MFRCPLIFPTFHQYKLLKIKFSSAKVNFLYVKKSSTQHSEMIIFTSFLFLSCKVARLVNLKHFQNKSFRKILWLQHEQLKHREQIMQFVKWVDHLFQEPAKQKHLRQISSTSWFLKDTIEYPKSYFIGYSSKAHSKTHTHIQWDSQL